MIRWGSRSSHLTSPPAFPPSLARGQCRGGADDIRAEISALVVVITTKIASIRWPFFDYKYALLLLILLKPLIAVASLAYYPSHRATLQVLALGFFILLRPQAFYILFTAKGLFYTICGYRSFYSIYGHRPFLYQLRLLALSIQFYYTYPETTSPRYREFSIELLQKALQIPIIS